MSDSSQGEGWWLASDGNWYPPTDAQITYTVKKVRSAQARIGLAAVVGVAMGIGGWAAFVRPDQDTTVESRGEAPSAKSATTEAKRTTTTEKVKVTVITVPPTSACGPESVSFDCGPPGSPDSLPENTPHTTTTPPPPTTAEPYAGETVSQRNARSKASDYLDYTSFSRSGLVEQLVYEGFSQPDATYAVDAITVDWDAQAAAKAASYLEYTSFSRSGLVDQLLYEGFTQSQAEYGVSTTGLS